MRVTSKGQVTIPQEIREQFGIMPNSEVEFVVKKNGDLTLVKNNKPSKKPVNHFEAVRGSATMKMTTQEIMHLMRGWPLHE